MPCSVRICRVLIDKEYAEAVADKAIDAILFELSKETRTLDVTKYILRKAKERAGLRTIEYTGIDKRKALLSLPPVCQ